MDEVEVLKWCEMNQSESSPFPFLTPSHLIFICHRWFLHSILVSPSHFEALQYSQYKSITLFASRTDYKREGGNGFLPAIIISISSAYWVRSISISLPIPPLSDDIHCFVHSTRGGTSVRSTSITFSRLSIVRKKKEKAKQRRNECDVGMNEWSY